MGASDQLPIDARLLEPFVVLAEELHFTRAAERLHVAQPALSQQIARLERQVGARLFTRPPQDVALTPAGEALLRRVRPALIDLQVAVEDARAVATGRLGTLSVAYLSGLAWRVAPALAAAFRDAHPRITLRLQNALVEDQLTALRAHRLDVGLFTMSRHLPMDEDIVLDQILSAPLYVALHPSHRLAGQSEIRLEELADESWIAPTGYLGDLLRTVASRHGFQPRVTQQYDSVEVAHGMVAAGFGIAPASWLFALRPLHDMVLRPVPDETLDLVAAHVPPRAPATDAFLAVARDVIGRIHRSVESL